MRVIWEAFGLIHLLDEEEHRGQLIKQQRRLSTQEVTALEATYAEVTPGFVLQFADWTFAPSDVSRPSILFIESRQAAEKYARSLKAYVDLREARLYQFKKRPKQL